MPGLTFKKGLFLRGHSNIKLYKIKYNTKTFNNLLCSHSKHSVVKSNNYEINMNSVYNCVKIQLKKILDRKHTIAAGCTSRCPYMQTVFFLGSFPNVPNKIGGKGKVLPSGIVCVPTSSKVTEAPSFSKYYKNIYIYILYLKISLISD